MTNDNDSKGPDYKGQVWSDVAEAVHPSWDSVDPAEKNEPTPPRSSSNNHPRSHPHQDPLPPRRRSSADTPSFGPNYKAQVTSRPSSVKSSTDRDVTTYSSTITDDACFPPPVTVTAAEVMPEATAEVVENAFPAVRRNDDSNHDLHERQHHSKRFYVTVGIVAVVAILAVVAGGVCLSGACSSNKSDDTNEINLQSGFDCSDADCVFFGTDGSYPFRNKPSFLVAQCFNTNFKVPLPSNCGCTVHLGSIGDSEKCQSCAFLENVPENEWEIAFDCSNILEGSCVGKDQDRQCITNVKGSTRAPAMDPSSPSPSVAPTHLIDSSTIQPSSALSVVTQPTSQKCFQTSDELREAVQAYLLLDSQNSNNNETSLAQTYGWPIGAWCVSQIEDFSRVFKGASSFTEDIGDWDMSSAVVLEEMFADATYYRGDGIARWNVARVTSMRRMFFGVRALSGTELGAWTVDNVQDMAAMFDGASSLNADLSSWNTASVVDMSYMFQYCESFNGNISSWDTQNVVDMRYMFRRAAAFDGDISLWDVRNVASMDSMFLSATNFGQNLCPWLDSVPLTTAVTNMFADSSCPVQSDPVLPDDGPMCFPCT